MHGTIDVNTPYNLFILTLDYSKNFQHTLVANNRTHDNEVKSIHIQINGQFVDPSVDMKLS